MNRHPYYLFIMQAIAHCGLVWAILNYSLWQWLIIFFVYFLTGCIGVSMTLHRYYSHQSFEFKFKIYEYIGIYCAFWGLIGSPIAWVNTHRAHHRYTDGEKDPHSPHNGFIKAMWGSMFTSPKTLRYVSKMTKSKLHMFVHKYYFAIHAFILLSLLLWSPTAAAIVYLAPAAILWNMGSLVNTICHMGHGYRNFVTSDTSINNRTLGLLVWGEGYHNNHHAYPNSPKFGKIFKEIDITWEILKLIKK